MRDSALVSAGCGYRAPSQRPRGGRLGTHEGYPYQVNVRGLKMAAPHPAASSTTL